MTQRLLIVLAAMTAGCLATNHSEKPAEAPTPAATEVFQLASSTLETTLRLPAELSPHEAVDIRTKVAGFVAQITVDRGSRVRADDLLVKLRVPELTAQRVEAEARSRAQQSTYQRLQEASQTPGAVAAQEVDVARTNWEAESARAESLTALQGYTTIRAPFAGLITRRNVHPGALVSPSDQAPLLRLENVASLRLTVAVPEQATGAVAIGTVVTFAVSAYPGERFSGVIQRSAGSIDATTRTMPVEIDVANADGRLAPGSYGEVAWPVRREKTFLVPRSALVQTPTRLFVVCVRDGKAARVDVQRGVTQGDSVEIFGDIKEGETVVKRASEDLAEGTPVRVS